MGVEMAWRTLSGNTMVVVCLSDMDCPPILSATVAVERRASVFLSASLPIALTTRAQICLPAASVAGLFSAFGVVSAGGGMLISILVTLPRLASGWSKSADL